MPCIGKRRAYGGQEAERLVRQRAYFIDDTVPTPDQDAGSNAAVEHMRALLALGYKVTFLPADNMACIKPYTGQLQKLGIECPVQPYFWSATSKPNGVRIRTPWVTYPGLYTGQCRQSGGASWLQVTATPSAGDPRPTVTPVLGPNWGYHTQDVNLALGEDFHARRLTLKSSQVGAVGEGRRARWTLRRRMELALSLLTEPALDVLINAESRFEDLPQTLEQLTLAPGDVIMHRVKYA